MGDGYGGTDRLSGSDQQGEADFDRARKQFTGPQLGARLQEQDLESLLSARTDSRGNFHLSGIGNDRIVELFIEGPGIQPTLKYAYTRPGPTIEVEHEYRGGRGARFTFYGAQFEHSAPRSVPIVGTVRDKDTGEPIANVRIRSNQFAGTNKTIGYNDMARAESDTDGNYRLNGMPIGHRNWMLVIPSTETPYLPSLVRVDTSSDDAPARMDIALKRGVWIRGRVTDAKTGMPVVSHINYFVFRDNPASTSAPGLRNARVGTWSFYLTDEMGRFAVPGLPGRGLVTVYARDHTRYRFGAGADKIDTGRKSAFGGQMVVFDTEPEQYDPNAFHSLLEVELPQEGEKTGVDFQLDPGETLRGTVLDPQGRPLAGANCRGETPWPLFSLLEDETFAVQQYFPEKPRMLEFWHEERNLAGWHILEGPSPKPISVQLVPCGFLTGRIVDEHGEPLAKALIRGWARSSSDRRTAGEPPNDYYLTDEDGRYRIVGLAPGLKYNLGVKATEQRPTIPMVFDATVEPGEVKDLGDYAPSFVISSC